MTEAMHQVLVIEDEPGIRAVLRVLLTAEGYRCIEADTALRAEIEARSHKPDLLLIDLGLPDGDGLKVIRRVREWSPVPIVVLSARTAEPQRLAAFENGADDYIIKPFSPRELLARIQAVLRRAAPAGSGDIMEAQGLKLDDSSHRVSAGDAEIALGPTEYRLLHFFMTHPERVFSRGQLLDRVWGGNTYVEERTVDVHIRRLRKALEPFTLEGLVQTVRGAGYRFSTRDG